MVQRTLAFHLHPGYIRKCEKLLGMLGWVLNNNGLQAPLLWDFDSEGLDPQKSTLAGIAGDSNHKNSGGFGCLWSM